MVCGNGAEYPRKVKHQRGSGMLNCNDACLVCGAKWHEIHHIIPKCAGGTDEAENLIPLCINCHNSVDRIPLKSWSPAALVEAFSDVCDTNNGKLLILKLLSINARAKGAKN